MKKVEPISFAFMSNDNSNLNETVKLMHQKGKVITKLSNDSFKREHLDAEVAHHHLSFARSAVDHPPDVYQSTVIPLIEINSDLDNPEEQIRLNYEQKIISDVNYALYVCRRGPVYFKIGWSCNRTRVGQFLKQLIKGKSSEIVFIVQIDMISPEIYRQRYFGICDKEVTSSWHFWNDIHKASGYHHQIEVSLVFSQDAPTDEDEIVRWLGECIKMIVLPDEYFYRHHNEPLLRLSDQNEKIFRLFIKSCRPTVVFVPKKIDEKSFQLTDLFIIYNQNSIPSNSQSSFQNLIRYPLQPHNDDLDSETYHTFEEDKAKYIIYQRAIQSALVDMIEEEEKHSKIVTVMIAGAGRGPLVRAAINASKLEDRRIKIVVIEKNRSCITVLAAMIRDLWKDADIELIHGDMRNLTWEGSVDILVSELLGSFGDNEVSPECLSGVERFLKPTGISIPCKSISYLRPVMSKKVHSNILHIADRNYWQTVEIEKNFDMLMETSLLVYLTNAYFIDDPKENFIFEHPNQQNPIDHSRHKKLEFKAQIDCVMTGFSGYFSAQLYKNHEISIHPQSHTRGMTSWYSIYFALPSPINLKKDDRIEVEFWRKVDEKKVWYEYQLIAPEKSKVYNAEGKFHPIYL